MDTWDKFEELANEYRRLKEELEENAPDTLRHLTVDLESIVADLEEMLSYYSQ